jgi:phosphate transport system permease protein
LNPISDEAHSHALIHKELDRPFGSPFRSFINRCLNALCVVVSVAVLVPLASIIWLVIEKGTPLLSWQLFTQLPPAPGNTGGGFGNAMLGTAMMVGAALLMASPIGILSAIYICEYAPSSQLAGYVRFTSKLLTGIPSIICGVFAYAVVVQTTGSFSALAGSLALAVLALPTIIITTEQALLGVPRTFREASYGLGASRYQTIWRAVLPEALPAIMTGLMLALARAAGETAPVLFTALFNAYWNVSPMQPTASLAVLIYTYASLPYDYQIQMAWTASLVLVVLVTIANVTAQLIFRKRV